MGRYKQACFMADMFKSNQEEKRLIQQAKRAGTMMSTDEVWSVNTLIIRDKLYIRQ